MWKAEHGKGIPQRCMRLCSRWGKYLPSLRFKQVTNEWTGECLRGEGRGISCSIFIKLFPRAAGRPELPFPEEPQMPSLGPRAALGLCAMPEAVLEPNIWARGSSLRSPKPSWGICGRKQGPAVVLFHCSPAEDSQNNDRCGYILTEKKGNERKSGNWGVEEEFRRALCTPEPLCQGLPTRQGGFIPIAQGYAWRHLLELAIYTKAAHPRPPTTAEKISERKITVSCGPLITKDKTELALFIKGMCLLKAVVSASLD